MNLEELKWKKFPVLNDGHICLVDVMGNDYSVVEAARVSYGEGTQKPSDDRTLIRYLMRHRHTTPFEMAEIKLRVRVPMDCWRQWIRHRTANVNEYSTRYSVAIDSAQTTDPKEWRAQAKSNRQGSDDFLDETMGKTLSDGECAIQSSMRETYDERIEVGVAREQARKDLPLSTYTEAYWKIDLHNMLGFLALRMDSHAQEEIRAYATIIGNEIVKPLFPMVWEAFENYRLGAMVLSKLDIGVIQRLTQNKPISSTNWLLTDGNKATLPYSAEFFNKCQDENWKDLKRCRERDECFEKLARLGLVDVPVIRGEA